MFKNLKSLFIIEEEDDPKMSKSAAKPGAKKQASSSNTGTSPPVISESEKGTPGTVTKKFMEVLIKALEQGNLGGFDYLEFKRSLISLKKMPMDEATRYQSAFAMAQTMGVTPPHLMQTAEHYIGLLKKEEEKFEEALAKQKEVQIVSKQKKIQQLEQEVKAKTEQIKKLNAEKESHRKSIEGLKKQISDAAVKVESTKNNFIASYNALVGQIHTDLENMKKYLK